ARGGPGLDLTLGRPAGRSAARGAASRRAAALGGMSRGRVRALLLPVLVRLEEPRHELLARGVVRLPLARDPEDVPAQLLGEPVERLAERRGVARGGRRSRDPERLSIRGVSLAYVLEEDLEPERLQVAVEVLVIDLLEPQLHLTP